MSYATAGLATAAATAPAAEAGIHYFSPVHIHLKGQGGTWQVPLTAGASLTFYRGRSSAPVGNTYFFDVIAVSRNAAVHAIRSRGQYGPTVFASNLPAGSNVSGGRFYSGFLGLIGFKGQFVSAGIGFVGFKFDVGNGVQYGWVRLRTDNGGTRTDAKVNVLDYAFADPGEPIRAGQTSTSDRPTPDQGSLGLLALGAVGLQAWRKSRRNVSSAAL